MTRRPHTRQQGDRLMFDSRTPRSVKVGAGAGVIVFLIWFLVWAALVAGTIFVAVHFITKYW